MGHVCTLDRRNVECIGVRYMLSLDAQMTDAGVDAEADGELQVEPSTQGLSLFFLPIFPSFFPFL